MATCTAGRLFALLAAAALLLALAHAHAADEPGAAMVRRDGPGMMRFGRAARLSAYAAKRGRPGMMRFGRDDPGMMRFGKRLWDADELFIPAYEPYAPRASRRPPSSVGMMRYGRAAGPGIMRYGRNAPGITRFG